MDGLDFSGLSDDQLVELARACCLEAVRRNAATAAAMEQMMLSEAEKARIARSASEMELAAQRAADRQRIAQEARAKVRAEEEARTREARAAHAAKQAQAAAEKVRAQDEIRKRWLTRFAELLGREPAGICLVLTETRYGRRLIVNVGDDRWARDHLMDYNIQAQEIKTPRAHVKSKPALAALAAEYAAKHPTGDFYLAGANHDWSQQS